MRSERLNRNWSLDHAAARLGVSRRLLTQIESGSANPSLSTLLSIANGFGFDLTCLLASPSPSVDVVFQPDNATADAIWATDRGSSARLLVGMGPLEMWSWRLEPGDTRHADAHSPDSLEALVVTSGALEIELDGADPHRVKAGQSLIFAADRPHTYRNPGKRSAAFHLAVFDPISHSGNH